MDKLVDYWKVNASPVCLAHRCLSYEEWAAGPFLCGEGIQHAGGPAGGGGGERKFVNQGVGFKIVV